MSVSTQPDATARDSSPAIVDICIVDDDPAIVEMLRKTLANFGYRSFGTSNPHEALEYVRRGNCSIVLCDLKVLNDFIDVQYLPEHLQRSERAVPATKPWRPLPLEEVRREHIERVLELCSGNRVRAAQMLGIGRTSLYRYLKREGRVRPVARIPAA